MDSYIGEIKIFAGDYAPQDWHLCDGSLLTISSYEALYTLLGTIYGGDGVNTFAIPDMRGRVPLHMGVGAGLSLYPLGAKGGTETVTLQTNNMPAHTHTLSVSTQPGTTTQAANNFLAAPADTRTPARAIEFYLPDSSTSLTVQPMLPGTITVAPGSGAPHENRQPTIALSYIICLRGIYPSPQ